VLRLFAAVLLGTLVSGCYLLQAAHGQWSIARHRQPIDRVLASSGTPDRVRGALLEVKRIRRYASDWLALPDNASYTSYADIGRRYVVWNVFATPEFSVEPLTWCFPVAGCVAYRGYFSEAGARDYALGLEARGRDVLVGGVPAYSTLGHFADPVLSTMIDWDRAELAALVFHELAHQVAYAKDDSAFNEAFATAVEREGVRRWSAAEGVDVDPIALERRGAQRLAFARFATAARNRLRELYATSLPPPQMRVAKREFYERLRADYAAARDRGELPAGYDRILSGNAGLLAVATYEECVPGFARLLDEEGGDLPRFYARVAALARLSRGARRTALGFEASGSCR
jgi:predicted aminopeptidase